MKLVTAAEMRWLEQQAAASGLSYDTMMENAGRAAALAIRDRPEAHNGEILVLVGPGNNGGDGLVLARYLHRWGHRVVVYVWRRGRVDDINLERAKGAGVPILWSQQDAEGAHLARSVHSCDVLVDALLGTGVTGALRSTLPLLLERVGQALSTRADRTQLLRGLLPHKPSSGKRGKRRVPLVVALDLPSGLDSDSGAVDRRALVADLTVTFAFPKRGQMLFPGAAYVGELLVADIGIDPELAAEIGLQVATLEEVGDSLPRRPVDGHKGTFGKAMIVGGSTNYVGAPCLAAMAAYRVGAGLVTLGITGAIYPMVATKLIEATFIVLPGDMGALVPAACRVLSEHLAGYSALLVGPGLGQERVTGEFLQALLTGAGESGRRPIGFELTGAVLADEAETVELPPLVLDADGLNLVASQDAWWTRLPPGSVVTPHPGEMARLLQATVKQINQDRISIAAESAKRWDCTVVLKGAHTIVASPEGETTIIPIATSALATAGSGDVLAGAITGLMAQGMTGYDAAVAGAYLHGTAGQLGARRFGEAGMVAGDLLALLPEAASAARGT